MHLMVLLTPRPRVACQTSRLSNRLRGNHHFYQSTDLRQIRVPAPSPAEHLSSEQKGRTEFFSHCKKQTSL